jgi:hypothetical protein
VKYQCGQKGMMAKLKPEWSFGTAEGSRRAVLEAGKALSFREKLEWLEKAEELSRRMQRTRRDQSKKLG